MKFKPITHSELRARLRTGIVHFAFKKLNGDLRAAVGTTSLTSIPIDKHPKGGRESSPKAVVFFDIEKREWRSVSTLQEVFAI